MKRGFKSQSERRSGEVRKGLNIRPEGPLSAFALSSSLKVVIWSESDIANVPSDDIAQLTRRDPDSWHAFTLRISGRNLIVYNSSQSDARINSVLMHELAHILLGHELHDVAVSEDGMLVPSNFSQEQEDEANWLGGTLLLPRPALLSIRKKNLKDDDAIQLYSVSRQMLEWRFRMTGVDYQIANSRRKES